ncbi:FAD-dependent oxidoreductase [Enemella sp. A6]|uniref:FAD-dependent oxidoreductase n=1 Tax=Enemella sp. A6 TaxID=3440152 RepID=UPI003EC04323
MNSEGTATEKIDVDLLVIGWGKAGKTIAKNYATQGHHVAIVERDPGMYGGTCINVACVPTKDLVVSAEQRRPDDDPAAWFAGAVRDRDALIGKLNQANYDMLDGSVQIIDGEARFVGPHEVEVATSSGPVQVSAARIVINTGSSPRLPDIDGVDLPGVYNSTTIQHADPFPKRLCVIGAGFIGLEFASMMNNFGAEVTLLNHAPALLPDAEPAVAEAVVSLLDDRGITLINEAEAQRIEQTDQGLRVVTSQGDFTCDAVLLATGRTPATATLNLAAAGIETDDRGFVVVDEHLRTNVEGIWATGDVNGGPQFTYISYDDHRIVMDQLTGSGELSTKNRVGVPNVTFLTPPLAQVGLTPRQAKDAGHEVLYAAKPVANIAVMPRPKILGETHGVITCTADAKTRKILGTTLFCTDSQEVINMVALAIRLGASVEDLRDGIWTHPSSTEAFNEVLGELAPWSD